MCKINGHSIWSYAFRPANSWFKLFNSKNEAKAANAEAQRKASEKKIKELSKPETNEVEGELPVPAAPITPVKTTGTGINNTTQPRIGLNL